MNASPEVRVFELANAKILRAKGAHVRGDEFSADVFAMRCIDRKYQSSSSQGLAQGWIRASVLTVAVGLLVGCTNSRPTATAPKPADATSTLASSTTTVDNNPPSTIAVETASPSTSTTTSTTTTTIAVPATPSDQITIDTRIKERIPGLMGFEFTLRYDAQLDCIYLETPNGRVKPIFHDGAIAYRNPVRIVSSNGGQVLNVDESYMSGGGYFGKVHDGDPTACGATEAHGF